MRERRGTRLGQLFTLTGLILGLTGCFLFTEHEHGGAGGYGYFESGCGPADGPALTLHLTERPVSCERLHEIDYNAPDLEHLGIDLYGISRPEAGHAHRVGPDVTTAHTGGWARQCPGDGGACAERGVGRVTFGETTRGEALVEVDLTFEDGARVRGRYPLQRCEARILFCG